MPQKTSFYQNDELKKVLTKYVTRYKSQSKAIANLVLGIDTMYRIERRFLCDLFTPQEIELMLENALSTEYHPQHIAGAVLTNTEDEVQSNFDYFKVSKDAILTKLSNLTVSQQYALVDWLIEMRSNSSAVFTTIPNLKDWLNFHSISEEKAAEICGASIETIQQWIAGKCTIPQKAIKLLEMGKWA